MSDSPDPNSPEHAELVDRLRALGETAVDPAVASAHQTAMTAVAPTGPRLRPGRQRIVRAKVAAAFAAGLVLGGTGLASAGALGTTPQNAVADAAAHVGVDLPGGTARSTEGCGGRSYKNHGEFVSQGGDPHSPCGKPVKSTTKPDNADQTDKTPDANAAHGCGKPVWAGKGNHANKTPAAVAARKAACGDDSGETDDADAKHETPTTSGHASTPTTVPAPRTTTTAPSTTTTAPRSATTSSTTTP